MTLKETESENIVNANDGFDATVVPKKKKKKKSEKKSKPEKSKEKPTKEKRKKSKKTKIKEWIHKFGNFDPNSTETWPVVTRAEWGARSTKEAVALKFPVMKVLFTQTKTEECFNKEDCIKIVQRLQNEHMDVRGLPDIQYNFLIGSDKNIYEGRGWTARPDKNEKYPELFDKYIEYAYIGKYSDMEPPDEMQGAAWDLLEDGITKDMLSLRFRVFEDYYQPSSREEYLAKKYVNRTRPERGGV